VNSSFTLQVQECQPWHWTLLVQAVSSLHSRRVKLLTAWGSAAKKSRREFRFFFLIHTGTTNFNLLAQSSSKPPRLIEGMGLRRTVLIVAACLIGSDAFSPSLLSISRSLPAYRAPFKNQRTGSVALRAQFFGSKQAKAPPPTEAARQAAAAGLLQDDRGNNVGDTRYTVSYSEDMSMDVEDLPAGTTEEFMRDLALRLKDSPVPRDLRPDKITYKNSMIGSEVVDWMIRERIAPSRRVAVAYGRQLVRLAEVVHVARGHDFKDEGLFYRFVTPYEKGIINPQTPYQWFLRWAATPPLTFSVIFIFLFLANLPYFVPGAPDLFGVMQK
jgi:hypothetical protein